MNELRARLTYANVMATIAVFSALGGASYAAVKLPKNSVGTKQLKANAVTAAKVQNGSLTTQDFGKSQLPAGPTGKEGPPGPPGAPGVAVVVSRYGPSRMYVGGDSPVQQYVACAPGEKVTGGGFDVLGIGVDPEYVLLDSRPAVEEEFEPGIFAHPPPPDGGVATGWVVRAKEEGPGSAEFRVYVQCASP